MNVAPVPNQSKRQQERGDQQQANGLRGVERVTGVRMGLMPIIMIGGFGRRLFKRRHAGIVALRVSGDAGIRLSAPAPGGRMRPRLRKRVLHYGVVDACSPEQQSNRALWGL